jgi:histidine ammonia-lyase
MYLMKYSIDESDLSIQQLENLHSNNATLELADSIVEKIDNCRSYLEKKIHETTVPIYGINTGFGSLYKNNIDSQDLDKLQHNLVRSHACGTGNLLTQELTSFVLLLKIKALSLGYSGVRTKLVQRLIDFWNNQWFPVIYEYGSLGASGDLAPLAHLALPLLGEGELFCKGEVKSAKKLLLEKGLEPIQLKAKEGLALLNGTQLVNAYGCYSIIHAKRLLKIADMLACLSLDAFDCRPEPFSSKVQDVRPHPGQRKTAQLILETLADSEIFWKGKKHVQDPYSFRCVPQVHGASHDVVLFCQRVIEREVNSSTDNPLIFPETDQIISAGNFHAQPIAMALDQLCIAISEIGSISERRIYQLISGSRELPEFLIANPGINSGFMIPQYTAAGLVSHNKQLSSPSVIDSIVSSNGQEDHVSMGSNSGIRTKKVLENLYEILAIELFTAAQALEFRRPFRSSNRIEELIRNYRQIVPFMDNDRTMYPEIRKTVDFLKSSSW